MKTFVFVVRSTRASAPRASQLVARPRSLPSRVSPSIACSRRPTATPTSVDAPHRSVRAPRARDVERSHRHKQGTRSACHRRTCPPPRRSAKRRPQSKKSRCTRLNIRERARGKERYAPRRVDATKGTRRARRETDARALVSGWTWRKMLAPLSLSMNARTSFLSMRYNRVACRRPM